MVTKKRIVRQIYESHMKENCIRNIHNLLNSSLYKDESGNICDIVLLLEINSASDCNVCVVNANMAECYSAEEIVSSYFLTLACVNIMAIGQNMYVWVGE